MASAERVGSNIKLWRVRRGMTQARLGELIGSDAPRAGRLENGKENPTLETLDKLAAALDIDVHLLTEPRPDDEAGHADTSGPRAGNRLLAEVAAAVDGEMPAEDTWRGDVLKAIAVLNRSLRRGDSNAPTGTTSKAGR